MSAIKEALAAMKEVLLLTERVEQTGKILSEVVSELRNHEKRLIRLETFIEIGKMKLRALKG
ncbi:MAG: hypothetical protein OS130_03940 [Thermodesulfobacteriota bacterium]|jgi:hypothetical protein|nr:MAG: hypothetical protein OS130_03940 [Thermodesulfobacteriota bacterium]